MPTARGQSALEEVLLKPYPPRVRVEAGDELVRHLQRNQVLLNPAQIESVVNAFAQEKDGPIKVRMGMVVGVISRDPRRTGELLRGFDPLCEEAPRSETSGKAERRGQIACRAGT